MVIACSYHERLSFLWGLLGVLEHVLSELLLCSLEELGGLGVHFPLMDVQGLAALWLEPDLFEVMAEI